MTEALPEDPNRNHALRSAPEMAALMDEAAYRTILETLE